MDRIFQHYEGTIDKLAGAALNELKVLVDGDSEVNDVICLWLRSGTSWFRIFIDGAYCGVDEYKTDGSDEDLDDGISCVDRSEWGNVTIDKAQVSCSGLPRITLTLNCSDGSCLVLACDQHEHCRFERRMAVN